LRFNGEAFRTHDPNWSWTPLSGAGPALKGRRFNWPGLETLYLPLSFNMVFREVSAGFAHRLTPYILCSYDVDCEDIVDLRTDTGRAQHGIALDDFACAWSDALIAGREPASWGVVRCVLAEDCAGILVPSIANGATPDHQNLVLWRRGPDLPHKVTAYDPTGSCRGTSCLGRRSASGSKLQGRFAIQTRMITSLLPAWTPAGRGTEVKRSAGFSINY
jgi:RES domain-containing protein